MTTVAEPSQTNQSRNRVVGQAFAVLAAVALCFTIQTGLIGALRHDRGQDLSFTDFRGQLANATAPVGPLDDTGHLLAEGTAVAVVEIPAIGVHEVVGEGTSSEATKSGPGHRRDTVLPGQAGGSVIMGRRAAYGGPFARIGELHVKDEITVITGQGRNTFRVLDVRHAGDPQPPPLASGQGRLVLVTADGPAFLPTDVLRVDAELTSEVQQGSARLPAWTVPESEQAMAGDDAVLVPVVLWALMLVACAVGVVWVRQRTGRWQAWLIGVPALGALGITVVDQAAALLPNLL